MGRHIPVAAVVATLCIALACDNPQPVAPPAPDGGMLFARAPAAGNGGKQVIPVDDPFTVDCGTETISAHVVGFLQIRTLDGPDGRKVVGINTINFLFTFTNSAGATFSWREVGADVFTIDEDGFVLHAFVGRAGEFGIIGRVVRNEDTGELEFVAGNNVGNVFANACAALT